MSEGTENIVRAIKQSDPFFKDRQYLDFQFLRTEAITHIGKLSGKIWTDHNPHDPGITILEVLCYALIDLGHRNTFPIEDLLAVEQHSQDFSEDDNFFTPLEILTCNPTTIIDYRKLLLEVEGVRNAWVEPSEDQEVGLVLDANNQLTCTNKGKVTDPGRVVLNGLYSISIEPEPDANLDSIAKGVRKTLSAYRNLCEDFKDIKILCTCEVGVCADVKVDPTADAAIVYEAVLRAVKSYIAPELNYYTLQQLLDKDKSVEEIFAGRPFSTESYGFVDTEELEQLPLRKELHLSDVYRIIAAIPGVTGVNNLSFVSDINSSAPLQPLRLPVDFAPAFSFVKTCIQLRSGQALLHNFDKVKIEKKIAVSNKVKTSRKDLDIPIPLGTFHPELDDYYSIQRDFPLVYGIGEGGLSEDETILRKVQALQLKGYLLFYDQLLANFLSQITHLRQLFSLRQESSRPASDKRTYFNQMLDDVPGISQLLQMYAAKGIPSGSFLAVPVANNVALAQQLQRLADNPQLALVLEDGCGEPSSGIQHFTDSTDVRRQLRIQQAIRDAEQGDFTVAIHQDKEGYFFIICFTQIREWVMIGYQRYTSSNQAREAANFAAFLATKPEQYQKMERRNSAAEIDFLYDLVYAPIDYGAYLQYLLEDEKRYCERRGAFLDHLLARFSSQFTDYSLLRFGTSVLNKAEKKQDIEDKSAFLENFDDLSRNRGRAFNYLQPSWGTDNISGFERRVAMLSGMNDWKKRRLCKFEVAQSYSLGITDIFGQMLCKSTVSYPNKTTLKQALSKIMLQLRDPASYPQLSRQFSHFDETLIRKQFSEIPEAENVVTSSNNYALHLINSVGGIELASQKQDYPTDKAALKDTPSFLNEIEKLAGLQLQAVGKERRVFIDTSTLQYSLEPNKNFQWRQYGKTETASETAFPDEWTALENFAAQADLTGFIESVKGAFEWEMTGLSELALTSIHTFSSRKVAEDNWSFAKAFGQHVKNYTIAATVNSDQHISLCNDEGIVLATATIPEGNRTTAENQVKTFADNFTKKKPKVSYPHLKETVYQVRFLNAKETLVMEGAALFRNIPAAISHWNYTIKAAKADKNYFTPDTPENPDYRIFLRDTDERLLAVSPATAYPDPKARDTALKTIKKELKLLAPLVELVTVEETLSWKLAHRTAPSKGWASTRAFESESAANYDFIETILAAEKNPDPSVNPHVYTIVVHEAPAGYRYVYELNSKNSKPVLLESTREYDTDADAANAYTAFIRALPNLQLKTEKSQTILTDGDIEAQLVENTAGNVKKASDLLEFMHNHYSESGLDTSIVENWLYRLTDRDNPVAKSVQCSPSRSAAESQTSACDFIPYLTGCNKKEIRVVCPAESPNAFHYAICLTDDSGDEFIFLHSYQSYETWDAAYTAGEANWLQIIELAAVKGNYGPGLPISKVETYSKTPDPCEKVENYLAVLPMAFQQQMGSVENAVNKAVALAKRFPFRVCIRKNEKGIMQSWFSFQGYDLTLDKVLWKSAKEYDTLEECEDAYSLFTVVIGNPNSCRIVCNNGDYCIELIEILAESIAYYSEDEVWGQIAEIVTDDCGKLLCKYSGVRRFSQAAYKEDAFIQNTKDDCFQFMVVDEYYKVAMHTCSYFDAAKRDEAMEKLRAWASGKDCAILDPHHPEIFQTDTGFGFRFYYEGNKATLGKSVERCGCREDEGAAPAALDFCGRPFVFESISIYDCEKAAENARIACCELLKDAKNYVPTAESGIGPYSFHIIDPSKILATYPYSFPNKEGAVKAQARAQAHLDDDGLHLIEHILLRPLKYDAIGDCKCLLPVCPEKICTLTWQEDLDENDPCAAVDHPALQYIPGSDPYSFWATAVLPAWHRRFQTVGARQAFLEMLHREAPAMVALNILWLSPKQMCQFETALKNWLDWRSSKTLCEEKNPLCALVALLHTLKNDDTCIDNQTAADDCGCHKPEATESDKCIVKTDRLFWDDCPTFRPREASLEITTHVEQPSDR